MIQKQLLTALEDKGTVAILASKNDLEVMIKALTEYDSRSAEELAASLIQLRNAAFP